MKTINSWVKRLVLALVVAGTVASASAAMHMGTAWTDEAGFLSRMPNPNEYFTLGGSAIQAGVTAGWYEDPISHYGFWNYIDENDNMVLGFTGMPTGVGARFSVGTQLTFTFSDGTKSVVIAGEDIAGSFFGGYTTDLIPTERYIETMAFPSVNLPNTLTLHAGLDTVIPEPSTVIAGALLLLPFAASTIRKMRRNG